MYTTLYIGTPANRNTITPEMVEAKAVEVALLSEHVGELQGKIQQNQLFINNLQVGINGITVRIIAYVSY